MFTYFSNFTIVGSVVGLYVVNLHLKTGLDGLIVNITTNLATTLLQFQREGHLALPCT